MTAVALSPATEPPQLSVTALVGLGLAAAIAWIEPFDRAFAAVSLGSPILRALLIVGLAAIGWRLGGRAGLSIEPPAGRGAAVPALVAAAVVGLWCAGVDWMFRRHLAVSYLQLFRDMPLDVRTLAFVARAFNENILYRLFLGSTLVWSLGHVWRARDGGPAPAAVWGGFALSQALNVWINVTSHGPLDALSLLHDGLRYFAPGLVWSGLYWRRGFRANETASTGVHLVFQPLAGLLLAG